MTRRLLALASALSLASVCGCTSAGASVALPTLAGQPSATPVTVTARDIASVVSLDAAVVANPSVTLAAPASGVVHFTPDAADPTGVSVDTAGGPVPMSIPEGLTGRQSQVPDGATVTKGLPILTGTYTGFALAATIPADKIYRLTNLGTTRAQLTAGPGPFDCPLLGIPRAADSGGTAVGAIVACAVPRDVQAILATPGIMAITTGQASGVPALPVEAVAGLTTRGSVTLRVGDTSVTREVGLGVSDGRFVQITSGLAVGDQVLIPAPGMPTP